MKVKLLIAGSRDILDMNLIEKNIKNLENIECIISGCARGVDTLAIEYAKMHNIECIKCPADWDKYGKSAGYIRNEEMVKMCTHALIIWDGKSKGTKHTIDLCKQYEIPYRLIQIAEYLPINGIDYNTLNIATFNTPRHLIKTQQQKGVSVIFDTPKAINFMVNSKDLTCIIFYGYPNEYMQDKLNQAFYKNKIVFIRNIEKNTYTLYKPTKDETHYTKFNIKNELNTYTDERTGRLRLSDKEKSELSNLIKYYELDYPQTDIEWVLVKEQLDFYVNNGIGYTKPEYTEEELNLIDSYQMSSDISYGFDTNMKHICPECGELVSNYTEHICYDFTEDEKTKLDYIVNGGE